ncbi:MAG: hypothetical protein ACXAB5_03475, partial [Candidatus Thorarchaeota archaeon]
MGVLESLDRFSTVRNLIVMIISSFVIVMVMAMLTQNWVYSVYGDVTMPDTRFVYTFSEISDVFSTLGQEGLIVWAQAHMLDFLFPLTYMLALTFGTNLQLRKSYPESENAKWLVLFPLFGGIFDYIENLLILTQISSYPTLSESVIAVASTITSLKWVF